MALRNDQGQWKKYLTLELSSVSNLVEDMCAIVSEFQSAKIGDEDRCRIRKDYAPANRVAVRPSALHLLRQEHTPQMRLRQQRLLCGLDAHSLLTVLCRATSDAITPSASPVRRVRSPWECSMDKSVLATTALLQLSCAHRPAASLVTTHRGHSLPTSSSHWSPHLCMGAGIPHSS
jgi:hypothetical protein